MYNFTDALLHHMWIKKNNTNQYQEFQQLIEKIQLTPRTWNSKNTLIHVLKHITWTLDININLLGFKQTKNTGQYFLYYKFQNTLVKLLRSSPTFNSIHILLYIKNYYILNDIDNVPDLIDCKSNESITYQGQIIMYNHIVQIISNQIVELPFSINIYTSYSYIKQMSKTHIQNNLVGSYICKNQTDPVLNIFISPHLEKFNINMCILSGITRSIPFNTKNIFYHNDHLPEGHKIFGPDPPVNQTTLNQGKKKLLLFYRVCLFF